MLEGYGNKRPTDASNIYIPDADLSILKQQLRAMDKKLDDAFANTAASVTLQEPKQDRLAAWVLYLPNFRCDKGLFNLIASKVSGNLSGTNARIVELDMGTQSFAVSIEDYEPSAYAKQLTYDISTLPK
jgi:DNA polymerase III delta subunit